MCFAMGVYFVDVDFQFPYSRFSSESARIEQRTGTADLFKALTPARERDLIRINN
jgi:hypothetical protein